MRTTIEISSEHRAQLIALAARRGAQAFAALVAEALDLCLGRLKDQAAERERALATRGSLGADEEVALREAVDSIGKSWR